MKIGDLIELSSRAKKVGYNKGLIGKLGVVTEKANPSSIHELYFVHWLDGQRGFSDRTDLKFVRRKK